MGNPIEILTDALEKLKEVQERQRPRDTADPRLRLFNALSVAVDQTEWTLGMLKRQAAQEPTDQMILIEQEGQEEPEEGPWCECCDNPKMGCTCP